MLTLTFFFPTNNRPMKSRDDDSHPDALFGEAVPEDEPQLFADRKVIWQARLAHSGILSVFEICLLKKTEKTGAAMQVM